MANEIRVRGNFVSGTLSGALTNVATSMSAAGLANLPVIGSTQHAVITIENEIVYVTAHTGGATTATILRGQEGTTAAAHSSAVAWVHGPVASDIVGVLGYAQVTANQGSITTEVDLTSLTITATVPYAQHRVKITGSVYVQNTGTNLNTLKIQQDGVQVMERSMVSGAISTTEGIHIEAVLVPTAASHTWKLRLVAAAGTATMVAAATFPAFLLVEDLGPAL